MHRYLLPVKHAGLLWQLSLREVLQQFRGSWLGISWSLLTPLAMLAVYTFVFRHVLKARWPGAEDSNTEFALQLFAGLLVFSLFSEIIGRAPRLITAQPNLVKKVIFPLEILPWVTLISALFNTALSLFVLLLGVLIVRQGLTIHVIATPLIILALAPLLLGFSWLLAALGTYIRDISHFVGLIMTPLLFLSPIFYPVSALPALAQQVIIFNPLTLIVTSLRAAVLGAQWPDMKALAIYLAVGLLMAYIGALFFDKTRKGFADVI